MGLFKWLQKRGLAGMIPRNAYNQYEKWRRRDASLSEEEIAQAIFSLRYISGNPILNKEDTFRLRSYMGSDFECKSLFDFCLASLDIEGHIDPTDDDAFYNVAKIMIEELKRLGFRVADKSLNNFVYQWSDHIHPHRK
jgi:hypothetical protein